MKTAVFVALGDGVDWRFGRVSQIVETDDKGVGRLPALAGDGNFGSSQAGCGINGDGRICNNGGGSRKGTYTDTRWNINLIVRVNLMEHDDTNDQSSQEKD